MLLRINYKNFLTHMIDFFPREDILSMHYLVISSGVHAQGLMLHVAKDNYLYPMGIVEEYLENGDLNIFRKSYIGLLKDLHNNLYVNIIEPILKYHHNIVLVCQESEDFYIDILVRYLGDKFSLPCVDLNKLFTEGDSDVFYIDRDKLHNMAVPLARAAAREELRGLEASRDGRLKLVNDIMSKKAKLSKLKELGVKVKKEDNDIIDELLIEVWVGDQ